MNKDFFKIHWNELLLFALAFLIFTPIGTISHEYGHVIAANIRGYESKLHYSSMQWNAEAIKKQLEILYLENEEDILSNEPFRDKQKMEDLTENLKKDSLFIIGAGPIQTMLTGVIGLVVLLFRRKSINQHGLKMIDWLSVFLSLFWLREVFNICSSLSRKIFGNAEHYFGGDEAFISTSLGLGIGVIPMICGFLGLCVFFYVFFKVIPIQKRLSFSIGGLLGGFVGLFLWMRVFGPMLLP